MSVWFAIPSKRPAEEAEPVLKLWRERGYRIALYVDGPEDAKAKDHLCDAGAWPEFISSELKPAPYPGYAKAVNWLVNMVLTTDPQAEWIVTGGDDVEPDANHSAEEIAAQCSEMFARRHYGVKHVSNLSKATFGVMQPTGDRWGEHDVIPGKTGAYIDRVCGSPWMGREFCRRMYQGQGPLYSGYYHMFEDEELQCVAQKLGVLWQRRDLIHYHRQWGRNRAHTHHMPEFLRKVNSREHWQESRALFESRQAVGFPGHEPIP